MPEFSDGAYDGESVNLSNGHVRLEMHRRPTGWGWGELYNERGSDEELLAVVEHLGEADLGGFPHRLRLSAPEYERETDERGERLRFAVSVQDVNEADEYMADEPPLTGTVTVTLRDDEPLVDLDYEIETNCNVEVRSLRGPWLRVGADSFGADRDDAIFPGIDWVEGSEHSSGTDWFEHPEARRVTPHPHKVSIPVMAVSNDGTGVGLSWNPDSVELSPMPHVRCPQPVFASPNFVDRRDDNLLGLMLPSVRWGLEEGELEADSPVDVRGGSTFSLDATVSVVDGNSLDVVSDWVQREGLPEPTDPRYEWDDAIEWLAECYDTNLWVEGEGFGADAGVVDGGSTNVPAFVESYVADRGDSERVASLNEKIEWCESRDESEDGDGEEDPQFPRPLSTFLDDRDRATEIAETLLDLQRDDGTFPYDPKGRHADFREEWSSYWRPLGQPGETDLGLCVPEAATLILAGRETGDETYVDAGLEALDAARQFDKPAGDDWWETPIHGPNLFAAGKAAIAYELAHEETGDESYRADARYWLRALLPFTHLWQPHEIEMRYCTKPCLVSTAWYLSDWTERFVQWEVLTVFAMADRLGLDLAAVDEDIDWNRYRAGITSAALDWIIDSRDDDLLYEFQFPREEIAAGEWDGLYADTFHPVDEIYGGGPITPDVIGTNLLAVASSDGD